MGSLKCFRFSSLRVRLILLILIAMIPTLGLILYSSIEHRKITTQIMKSNALSLTRLVVATHKQYIQASHQLLIALTQFYKEGIHDKEGFNKFLSNLIRQYPYYANLGVVNKDGDLLYSAIPPSGLINYSDRSWFKNSLKTRKYVLGDYVVGRLTGKRILPFALPYVGDKGQIEAIFFGAIDLEWLNELAAKAELPEGAALVLVDAHGTVLARYPEPEKWVGKNLKDIAIINAILTHREGIEELVGVDGIERLYAFSPLGYEPEVRAYICIGIPTKVAYAQVNRELIRNLMALFIVALLAILAAWLVGGVFVARPVNLLLKVTKRLADGDLTARSGSQYRLGELGQLAYAFDQMAESLQRREEGRKQAEDEVRFLQMMTQIIAESQDFHSALQMAIQRICESTGWVLGEAWIPSPDGKCLKFYTAWARTEGLEKFIEASRKFTFPPGIGLPGRAWSSKEPIWIKDITMDPLFLRASEATEAGLKGAMAVPVLHGDEVVTIMDFFVFEPREEDRRMVKLVSTIAIQLSSLIQRKRAEEEKRALEEQFRHSQKMEAIGRLAGGIAHDFNNLLTIIKGYCQISLPSFKAGDPVKENIEEVIKAADRAADLTRQLLAFSRKQVMEMHVLDLNHIIRNLEKMIRRMIGEDIDLKILLADNLGKVKADPGQIEQVLMNLVINAKDAMPGGGKLTIETSNVRLDEDYTRHHVAVTPGDYVMISVSDTGIGMTPEVRERVFEPFFTTKEKGKGTGLGLSTVYGIVKQSNGNIWIYSEPGKGTTFKIYLPRVDEPAEELRVKIETPELPRGNETILIVEDDEKVRKLAVKILENQGYEVLEAGSGEEALRIFRERKKLIHLILTDIVMPGMDGRQLVEKLKGIHQDFKVLYMSGYTDNTIAHHGVLEKGLNFIAKPLSVEGLARKVREVLDKETIW